MDLKIVRAQNIRFRFQHINFFKPQLETKSVAHSTVKKFERRIRPIGWNVNSIKTALGACKKYHDVQKV